MLKLKVPKAIFNNYLCLKCDFSWIIFNELSSPETVQSVLSEDFKKKDCWRVLRKFPESLLNDATPNVLIWSQCLRVALPKKGKIHGKKALFYHQYG